MPLGDRLFGWLVLALIGTWALGWVLLILGGIVTSLGFKPRASVEATFTRLMEHLGSVMKWSLYGLGVLLVIYLVASSLGWAPPLPPCEPGDCEVDRR